MKATVANTIFGTIGCWSDWQEKTRIVRLSAQKQGVDLKMIFPGEKWVNYYHNKIVLLEQWLKEFSNKYKRKKYFCFVDGRDVVFVQSAKKIVKAFEDFDDDKVYYNANRPKTWPVLAKWFADRIALRYGMDGIANSGVYIGKIDTILAVLEKCRKLNSFMASNEKRPGTIEGVLKQAFSDMKRKERTTPFQIGAISLRENHLTSDQFYVQLLQAQWDDMVQVDTERKVFACFADGWPTYGQTVDGLAANGWESNGSMPLGTAGILHSPYMFPRTKIDETKDDWESWAINEKII